MPRRYHERAWPSQFTALVAVLATRTEASVTLSLGEIETIIGKPLSVTATVSPGWWVSESGRLARDLRAIGWQARLQVKQRAVTFRRLG